MNTNIYKLNQAWAELINRYSWEWTATLTFPKDVTEEAAEKLIKNFIGKLNKRVFGANYQRKSKSRKKQGVSCCRVLEKTKSGRLHYHILLDGIGKKFPKDDRFSKIGLFVIWSRVRGSFEVGKISDVFQPYKDIRQISYLTKYAHLATQKSMVAQPILWRAEAELK